MHDGVHFNNGGLRGGNFIFNLYSNMYCNSRGLNKLFQGRKVMYLNWENASEAEILGSLFFFSFSQLKLNAAWLSFN